MPAKEKITGRQALVRVLRACQACGAVADEGARTCSCGTKLGSRKTRVLCAAALAPGLKDKTPEATLAAKLAVEARKPDGLFVRPPGTKGTFDLRERAPSRRLRAAS